jgi:hypothetical protein
MNVRRIALLIAVIGFLALAIVGMASGVPPFTCALRALGGAAVLFVLAMVVGRFILSVLVDAVMSRGRPLRNERDQPREHRN